MRRLALLLIVLPTVAHAQKDDDETVLPYDSATGKVTYTEVVKVDSVSSQDLYSRAKFYIANAFKNAKEATVLQDDVTNTIVCKGKMKAYISQKGTFGYIDFKLTIMSKDNRYKYSFTDFIHSYTYLNYDKSGGAIENEKPKCGAFYMSRGMWNKIKGYMHGDVFLMTEDLKKVMMTKINGDF